MATSGTTRVSVEELITASFIEAGLPSSLITAENMGQAKLHLRRMFDSWAQRGVLLWCLEKRAMRVLKGQMLIDLPSGVNKINAVNRRWSTELTGISINYSTGAVSSVLLTGSGSVIGNDISFRYSGNPTSDLTITYAEDGVNFRNIMSVSKDNLNSQVENYIMLPAVLSGGTVVLEMEGATFSSFKVFTNPSDLPLSSMSRDIYDLLPNKGMLSDPIQYWPNRTNNGYQLYLWPVPYNSSWVIVVIYKRLINDIESFTQYPDIPQAWYDSLIYGLAFRLLSLVPAETREDEKTLAVKSETSLSLALGDETDSTDVFFTPNIRYYTR